MREIKLKVNLHKNQTVMEALAEEGLLLSGTCGGMGTCGKCQVEINGQKVAACKYPVTEDVTVLVEDDADEPTIKKAAVDLPADFVCDQGEPGTYGVALDLGTTTVVVMVWDLHEGKLLDLEAVSNPQRFYGADVMSRMAFVMRAPWNLTRLKSSLMNEVNQTISKIVMKHGLNMSQIRKIVAVGNTAMSHFFLGEDISGLASYPFAPAFTGSVTTTARMTGLAAHEEAEVYVAPNLGGHVGSDITAGLLASGYMEEKQCGNRLFFDIGTNGEIVLTSKVKTWCCSAAAGPAFEGSALHQGMRAAAGAICQVALEDGTVKVQTIGNEPAKGICGSGIIDAMAVMVECGAVDTFGRILGPEEINVFPLTPSDDDNSQVCVTQQDVREIQMAKAAIAAGSKILMEKAGLTLEELTEVGIAGAFGNAIDLESGKRIGLLPKLETEKMRSLGNSAGIGASMLLLSAQCREKAEKIASSVEHVELATLVDFQNQYIAEMNF